jgi:hypothetical protein
LKPGSAKPNPEVSAAQLEKGKADVAEKMGESAPK